jgi:hypothetical protein
VAGHRGTQAPGASQRAQVTSVRIMPWEVSRISIIALSAIGA